MTTYIVKINSINLNVPPKSYSIKDVGRQINRMSFVNDVKVYYFDKNNASQLANFSYRDVSFSCVDTLAVCQSIESAYKAGNTVSFTDIYGNVFPNAIINSFGYEFVKSTQAYEMSIELIVIGSTSYIVRYGGSTVYGIESATVTPSISEYEYKPTTAGGKVVITKKHMPVYEVSLSGIETVVSGNGAYTSTLSSSVGSLSLPDGKTLYCMVASKNTSVMQGVEHFQKFDVKLVGLENIDGFIVNETFSSSIFTGWDISKPISETEVVGIGSSRKFLAKMNVPVFYNVTLSGLESVSGGSGSYTSTVGNTVSSITLPNGKVLYCLVSEIGTDMKPDMNSCQEFSVKFLGVESSSDIIVDSSFSSSVVTGWNVTKSLNETEIVGIGTSRKLFVKAKAPITYDVTIQGIESLAGGSGSYTGSLSSAPGNITLPDGRTLYCILDDFSTSPVQTSSLMQNFNAKFMAVDSSSDVMTSSFSGSIVTGWSVAKSLAETETVGIGASRKVLARSVTPMIYDVSVTGIESVAGGAGSYTHSLSSSPGTITLPDGETLHCLLVDFSTSHIPSSATLQNYSVKFLAVTDSNDMITGSFSGSIITSWSVDASYNDVEPTGAGTTRKAVIKQVIPVLYSVSITGIESVTSGAGSYTSGLSKDSVVTISLPNGLTISCIVASINTSAMPQFSGLQNFSAKFIGADSAGDFITSTANLLVSWSVTDDSGRFSVHKTIGGIVVQKFSRVESYNVQAEYLSNNKDMFEQGTTDSITLGGTSYSGIVTATSSSPIERTSLYRVSVSLTSYE